MSVYLSPIVVGIMLSLFIIYLSFIPILIHQYRRYGTLRIRRNIVTASFIVYMITAWFMTILPLPSFETVREMAPIHPNFKPFLFVKTFLENSGFVLTQPGTWLSSMRSSSFFTVAFNVVLTIPFGVYLRKYFKLSLFKAAVLGLLLSLFYETTQYTGLYGIYPKAFRFADVDDLIINTLGAVIGYFFERWIDRLLPNPVKDRTIITEKASLFRRLLYLLVDSAVISVLFELSRVAIYWNVKHKEWDLVIFLLSDIIVFLILPLLTKNKQTIGMWAMNLTVKDKIGQKAKTNRILLHNLLVGVWFNFIFGIQGKLPSYGLETLLGLLFSLMLLAMLIKSLLERKPCYYWEPWLNTYLRASLPDRKLQKNSSIRQE